MAVESYRDSEVWKQSIDLSVMIYRASESFPKSESFGLTSQMRRAANAIPANIAEGQRRGSKEFLHFLRIALGSGAELETHILIAHKVDLLSADEYAQLDAQLTSIQKMLNRLITVLTDKSK